MTIYTLQASPESRLLVEEFDYDDELEICIDAGHDVLVAFLPREEVEKLHQALGVELDK